MEHPEGYHTPSSGTRLYGKLSKQGSLWHSLAKLPYIETPSSMAGPFPFVFIQRVVDLAVLNIEQLTLRLGRVYVDDSNPRRSQRPLHTYLQDRLWYPF